MRFDHASIPPAPPSDIREAIRFRFKRGVSGVCLALALWSLAACQSSEEEASQAAALASELLAQNRIAEARLAIGEAIAARDDDPQLFMTQGRIELAANAPEGAFNAFYNALALDPANPEALQAVSQLGLQTGHWSESRRATETILTLDPNNAFALLTRGLHSLFSARLDNAEADADKVLSLNPFSDEGTVLKARVQAVRGNYGDALAILDRHAAARPASANVELMRLEILRALRDKDGLDRQFRVVREAYPDNLDLGVDQTNFLVKTGRTDEARRLAYRLLADPSLTSAQGQKIIGLFRAYNLVLADPEGLQLAARTASPGIRFDLALALVEAGQYRSASLLETGLQPDDHLALVAAIDLGEGRARQASDKAGQVLSRDPDHCLALRVRAQAQLGLGQSAASLRDAQRAADQCPGQSEGWRLAAISYARMGDRTSARRVWRQGSEANPQDVVFARHHADWLIGQNARREAVAVLRQLTLDSPALVPGWRAYLDICQRSDESCLPIARQGLADAATRYWIDYAPGERPPIGLFGRLVGV